MVVVIILYYYYYYFGNTFETCYWLVLNVNSDDCSGCFSFVELVVVVILFLNILELILFSIFCFIFNILDLFASCFQGVLAFVIMGFSF